MGTLTHSFDDVMDVCMLAGKIMLQSGAETYRVEDTMMRMGKALTNHSSHSYVTPTAIIFSVDGSNSTKMARIVERTTDLQKVVLVNQISRKVCLYEMTLSEARINLQGIEQTKHSFPVWLQILVAAIASSCFLIMFGGVSRDLLPAFITGGLGYTSFIYFNRLIKVHFFAEFLASFIIGCTAFLLTRIGFGVQFDTITIGSVMSLVPGLLITNAIRDLMAGHLVSGISKGAEAFLTAFAIGTGIAIVLAFF
ncbi:MAG: threonine/serine exporter family protein [Tuberibacillus sp.]